MPARGREGPYERTHRGHRRQTPPRRRLKAAFLAPRTLHVHLIPRSAVFRTALMVARPLQWINAGIDEEWAGPRTVRFVAGLPGLGADAVRFGERRLAVAADRSYSPHLCVGRAPSCHACEPVQAHASSPDLDHREHPVRGCARVAA